ncbi:MAG: hypothetical protein DRP57_02910 [Spirochaetes bacterium]|nr:MAG: hypothetical protein DRP57_02910 [Spirochaetota bacterium]
MIPVNQASGVSTITSYQMLGRREISRCGSLQNRGFPDSVSLPETAQLLLPPIELSKITFSDRGDFNFIPLNQL